MTITEETVSNFDPLTCTNRIKDIYIPEYLSFGGTLVKIPETLKQKDPHFLLNESGRPVRAAWISKSLAHLLNALRFEERSVKLAELMRAVSEVDVEIAEVIKSGVLKDKHGPGAMAFCQANANIPKDSIVLSARTWDTLCLIDERWKTTKTVTAIRFPNLGPHTTQELKVIINKEKGLDLLDTKWNPTTVGSRINNLKELLQSIELETYEDVLDTSNICDAFLVHPDSLKDGFLGDSDGDTIFIVTNKRGQPKFQEVSMVRASGTITDEQVATLFSKSSRIKRDSLITWLPTYFDDTPIGPATYAIRWMLYSLLPRFKNSKHPMSAAWKELSPEAERILEFVMDIRKGNWTQEQIRSMLTYIQNKNSEIRQAQNNGNWFAKTVTAGHIVDVPGFICKFPNLQTYVDYIVGKSDGRNIIK